MNFELADAADEPPGVVTTTSTVPAVFAGLVAVTVVAFRTENVVAGVPPNDTPVAPVRLVPVTVTTVPPAVDPLDGDNDVTVGAGEVGAWYVNFEPADAADDPPGVVTTTSTVPADFAGDTAVIDVPEFTTTPVAAVPPKVTPVAPVRFVPVIVTDVPPAVEPLDGLKLVTVGAGGVGAW